MQYQEQPMRQTPQTNQLIHEFQNKKERSKFTTNQIAGTNI